MLTANNYKIRFFRSKSAIFKETNPPSLKPVHQPTTAIEAAADIKFFSVCLNCSILRASMVMSCVDEQIAIKSPISIIKYRLLIGLIRLHRIKHI